MELDEALHRISEIHGQMQRGVVFRGYRAPAQVLIGGVALLAAGLQGAWVGADFSGSAVWFWVGVAGLSLVVVAADLCLFGIRADGARLPRKVLPVLGQYLPALATGAFLTLVLRGPEHRALLPGLWALLHGMGLFASRPHMPRAVGYVALWFATLGALWMTRDPTLGLSVPLFMGVTFGGGHLLLALVLHRGIVRAGERHHG